jgi:hypothetical protein
MTISIDTTGNMTCDQGSTFPLVMQINDTNGNPFNLTGYDARMQVRKTYGDTAVQINATLSNGKLVLNAAAGTVTLTLLPSDTSSIRFNSKDDDTLDCVYDVELQSASGFVFKPLAGTFTINREVTR